MNLYKATAKLLCVLFHLDYLMCLELTILQVPRQIPLGIRASLFCQWALGSTDILYSVKWYKDGKEFFRHVPGHVEPIMKFLLPGVDVQEYRLSGSSLTLAPAVMTTTGRYRCEVSGERPQFHTVSKYADMFVKDLSSHGLKILGFKSRYRIGDHVNVACLSDHVESTMEVSWYINGNPAVQAQVYPIYAESNKVINNSRLQFTVVKRLAGNLKLQCLVTIDSIYWRSIEKSAIVSGNHIMKDGTVLKHSTNVKSGCGRTKCLNYFYIFYMCLIWIVFINI